MRNIVTDVDNVEWFLTVSTIHELSEDAAHPAGKRQSTTSEASRATRKKETIIVTSVSTLKYEYTTPARQILWAQRFGTHAPTT